MPDPQPQGWTPVVEPSGWTPVAEPAKTSSGRGSNYDPNKSSWFADYVDEALASLKPLVQHPIETAKQTARALLRPDVTLTAMEEASRARATDAEAAFKRGDYKQAIRLTLQHAIAQGAGGPIFAPRLEQAGDFAAEGNLPRAAGALTDVAAQIAVPELARRIPGAQIPAIAANTNPAERAAVAFAQRSGIPVDAGTATGNRFVSGAQAMADTSPAGSLVAARAVAKRDQALATVGDQLAAKANSTRIANDIVMPGPSVTAEQAGQGVNDALRGRIQQFDTQADAAYGKLRTIASENRSTRSPQPGAPVESMDLPVDLRPVRPQLQAMYDRLLRERQLAPATIIGDKARALNALDNLMTGADFAPLETVDKVLGNLKALARGRGDVLPELRSEGQGAAAQAVNLLDAQVRRTAANAGPNALKALEEGRAATTAKYAVADVYDAIREEPVRAFNQAVAPKDTAIAQLRDVAKYVPDELPKIGRAWLDSLMDQATAEGGFKHAAKLDADWRRMGPETKRLLFQDPAYVTDLDNFFLVAKRMAESPNPSGTALTINAGGQIALAFTAPGIGVPTILGSAAVSKLLHSAAGVRLLTKGFRIPGGSTAATVPYAAELSRAIAAGGTGSMVPALATNPDDRR